MISTRKYLPLFIVAPLALLLDQWTKFLAVSHLTHGLTAENGFFRASHLLAMRTAPVVVSPNFWDFRYAENTGAAFSFLAGATEGIRIPFFYAVAVAASVLILYFYVQSGAGMLVRRLALAMVLGGAVGNTVDRFLRGYVIDFIHWHAGVHEWPVFNVADSFVCVGVFLLLTENLFVKKPKPSAAAEQPVANA